LSTSEKNWIRPGDELKLRVLRGVVISVCLICAAFLSYRGYQWWEKYQKRKALFVYFQKNSPVTKRIPADALLYANLYDLKRVHEDLRDTSLYKVFSHWLDTGMAENEKPNPLLGGMLEKTILNIIGEEIGLALLPSQKEKLHFLSVARITAGSDFLINLALSSAKNVEKIDSEDAILYRVKTKDPDYPAIWIAVDDDLAYASSNLKRLQQAYRKEGTGPDFLKNLSVHGIPEDTMLFFNSKEPQIEALVHGEGHNYRLELSGIPTLNGTVPDIESDTRQVVRVRTNAPAFIGRPTAAYSLQVIDGKPVSAVLLGFSDAAGAARYEESLLTHMTGEAPEMLQPFNSGGIDCRRKIGASEDFVCRSGRSLLLARGNFSPAMAKFVQNKTEPESPFVFSVELNKTAIHEFEQLVKQKDWSRFNNALPFYFLSCIKQIKGEINSTANQISIELE